MSELVSETSTRFRPSPSLSLTMLTDSFDAFLFDLDGVLYVGEKPTRGAVEALERLRSGDHELGFLTNDPRPSRQQAAEHLDRLGFSITPGEIVTAGFATARYLEEEGYESAYVVGSRSLKKEIEHRGVRLVTDRDPSAVVIGCSEETAYEDIRRASLLVQDGASFLATNVDASFPMPEGRWPGTGAIVEAVRLASGQEPVIVGKPEPLMFELAAESLGSPERIAVVGDNIETDILGAHRAGFAGILLSDKPVEDLLPGDPRRPDARIERLSDLFDEGCLLSTRETPVSEWPGRAAPGVGAVVLDGSGRVLLHRRRVEEAWAPPSGRLEPGESIEEAVVRELDEETGLDVDRLDFVGVMSDPSYQVVTYPSGERVQFITSLFLVRSSGKLQGSEEGLEWGWFDPKSLPSPLTAYARPWIEEALGSTRAPGP